MSKEIYCFPQRYIDSGNSMCWWKAVWVGGRETCIYSRPHWLSGLRHHLFVLQLFSHTKSGHWLLLYLPSRKVVLRGLSWLPITYRIKSKLCTAESKLFTICPLFPLHLALSSISPNILCLSLPLCICMPCSLSLERFCRIGLSETFQANPSLFSPEELLPYL